MTEKNACNHEKKENDIRTKMLMSHYNSVGYSVYGRNGISKKINLTIKPNLNSPENENLE